MKKKGSLNSKYLTFWFTLYCFLCIYISVHAQHSSVGSQRVTVEESDSQEKEVLSYLNEPLQKGAVILGGAISFQRTSRYTSLGKDVINDLNFNIRFLKLISNRTAVGINSFSNIYFGEKFNEIALSAIAAGPIVRFYPWQNNSIHSYVQGQLILGYNLALGDALGSVKNEGFRTRPGLRAGLGYRFSNTVGVFLEAGPDWEGEFINNLDSRGVQVQAGIQLFRF